MKKVTFFLLVLILSKPVAAQYKPVDQGSKVSFKIDNLGFEVNGSFSGLLGDIKFDPNNPGEGSFDVTIDAGTVNTHNGMRDNHIKEESYFDVKNYPKIRFVSKKITVTNRNGYAVTGILTIKGKSQEISFPFTVLRLDDGFNFKGKFKINRKDFKVGGSSTISDDLEVSLNVVAKKN